MIYTEDLYSRCCIVEDQHIEHRAAGVHFIDDVDSRKAENLLEVMEQIDDDCAKRGIHFVKVSEDGAAEQFGVARLPSLVFFKNDLPSLYEGT